MFGKTVKRHCPTCVKDVSSIETIAYNIKGKEYYPHLFCPICETDLAKEDREAIASAKADGESITTIMY